MQSFGCIRNGSRTQNPKCKDRDFNSENKINGTSIVWLDVKRFASEKISLICDHSRAQNFSEGREFCRSVAKSNKSTSLLRYTPVLILCFPLHVDWSNFSFFFAHPLLFAFPPFLHYLYNYFSRRKLKWSWIIIFGLVPPVVLRTLKSAVSEQILKHLLLQILFENYFNRLREKMIFFLIPVGF